MFFSSGRAKHLDTNYWFLVITYRPNASPLHQILSVRKHALMVEPWFEQGSLPFQGSATTNSAIRPEEISTERERFELRSSILEIEMLPLTPSPHTI